MHRVNAAWLVLLFLLLGLSSSFAQTPWAGILAPSRAMDWSGAGVPGGIPTRTTVCARVAPYGSSDSPASPEKIDSALAACPSGQVVLLEAGTFYLNAPIDFAGKSNVTLRGAGADQTKIVTISSTAICMNHFGAAVCIEPDVNASPWLGVTAVDWTGGYAEGTTSITLSSTAGLEVGMPMMLDQCDDGYSGSGAGANIRGGCGTGHSLVNDRVSTCVDPTVCSAAGSGNSNRTHRQQAQEVLVTGIHGSTVTIRPGLYMPNWRGSQSPSAWWPSANGSAARYVTGDGVEDMTFDMTRYTAERTQASAVMLTWAYGCWVTGNRMINTERNHVFLYLAMHNTVASNYMYGTQHAMWESYGVENWNGSDNLIENNISQHIVTPYIQGGPDAGVVWAYNYDIDDYYAPSAGWMMPGDFQHTAGSGMDLWEGNESSGFIADNIHGTHNLTTLFRNRFTGYQPSCYGTNCYKEVFAIQLIYVGRYYNIIGNVLGTQRVQSVYSDFPDSGLSPGRDGVYAIYAAGWTGPNGTYRSNVAPTNDLLTPQSMMRWGNFDAVHNAVEWDPSEVPSHFSDGTGSPSRFVNPVPANRKLPPSFFLPASGRPAWWGTPWGTPPWPAIGPDVRGGDIPAVGEYAYHIPAELCYANTPVDKAYQQSYAVTGATWTDGTVTLSVQPGAITEGEMTVTGMKPAGYNGTFEITASTAKTVSYRLGEDPGGFVSGGSMLYPNIRMFNAGKCYGLSERAATR